MHWSLIYHYIFHLVHSFSAIFCTLALSSCITLSPFLYYLAYVKVSGVLLMHAQARFDMAKLPYFIFIFWA